MIISPYCKKHDAPLRLLTVSHCADRSPFCERLECPDGMASLRLSAPLLE